MAGSPIPHFEGLRRRRLHKKYCVSPRVGAGRAGTAQTAVRPATWWRRYRRMTGAAANMKAPMSRTAKAGMGAVVKIFTK